MSLKICSLFSGSTGNCTYVWGEGTEMIIDAGVTLSKTEKALKAVGADISHISVLVTHRHRDHICGLGALVKKYPLVTVYAHAETAQELIGSGVSENRLKIFGEDDFYVGAITVCPFVLSHDVDCVGFCLRCGGRKITYMTDTGVLPPYALTAAEGSDLVLIESNHSPELLAANKSYSYPLNRRISGLRGHLSNEDCASAVVRLSKSGVKHFILAHLSRENNYPELAYTVCRDALAAADCGEVGLTVALPDRLSGLIEIV